MLSHTMFYQDLQSSKKCQVSFNFTIMLSDTWKINFLIKNPQNKRLKLEEQKDIKMTNIDLAKANSEMY